ncbi:hypothetical protein NKR19_g4596 [Coniochaeta hoffmannii]|uniref:Uncharacterized protein n=1 Tax=Coniochaeta hoffmannii TaxID=91930 RepID=A0AA38VY09_9PEZI|nr:hypothetical protein NKR19_g4596 [Coniochaeta hoffmannii]
MALCAWQKAVAERELDLFFGACLLSGGESASSAVRAASSHLVGLGRGVLQLIDAASENLGKLKEPILLLEQLVATAEEESARQRGPASVPAVLEEERTTQGLSQRTILHGIRQAILSLSQIDVRKALLEVDVAKLTRSCRIELNSGGPLSPTTLERGSRPHLDPIGTRISKAFPLNTCPIDFRTFDFRSSPSYFDFLQGLPFHQPDKKSPLDGDSKRHKAAAALPASLPLQSLRWPRPPSRKKAKRPDPTSLGSSWFASKEATTAVRDAWFDSRPPVSAAAEEAGSLGDEPLNVTVFIYARHERLAPDEIRDAVEGETAAAAVDGPSSDMEDDLMELADMLSRVRLSERTLPEGTLSAIREAVDLQNPHRRADLMSTEAARSDAEVRKSLEFTAALLEKLSLATVYANARARPLAEALGLSMQTLVLDEFFDSSARWFSKHWVSLPDTKEHAHAKSFLNAQYWRVRQVRDGAVAAGLSEVWDRLMPRLDVLVSRLRNFRVGLDPETSRRPASPGSEVPHKRPRDGSVDESSGRPYDAPVSLPPLHLLCYIRPQHEGKDPLEDDGTIFFEEVSLGAFFRGGRFLAEPASPTVVEPASPPPTILPRVEPADGVGADDIMTEGSPRGRGEGADTEIHKASPIETTDLMVCTGAAQEAQERNRPA